MKKRLMILGASLLQLPAYLEAKKMNIETIAVDINPNAKAFEYADIKEIVSTTDKEGVLKVALKYNIDGIMTIASDLPMQTVAFVNKKMNLKGIDELTALNATDKSYMRKILSRKGIPIPSFFVCESKKDFCEKVITMNYSCIVKPANSSGSRGIYVIEKIMSSQELFYVYEYSVKYSSTGIILVEEYIEGEEVSVESLSINGVCNVIQITDKITTGKPYFVEMGHSEPSQLPRDVIKEIINITERTVKAIGINDGPSHTEIKIGKTGPKVIEIGARLGGDNISTYLVPLSTGINMVQLAIKNALRENVVIGEKKNKGAAIKYFKTESGIFKSCIIPEYNEAKIVAITINKNVGDTISDIRNSTDRIGYVISQGENAESALLYCDEIIDKMHIQIDEV